MNGALLAGRKADNFWQTGTAITENAVAMFLSQNFACITKGGEAEPRHFITVVQELFVKVVCKRPNREQQLTYLKMGLVSKPVIVLGTGLRSRLCQRVSRETVATTVEKIMTRTMVRIANVVEINLDVLCAKDIMTQSQILRTTVDCATSAGHTSSLLQHVINFMAIWVDCFWTVMKERS